MTTFWFILYIATFMGALVAGTRNSMRDIEVFSITDSPVADDWIIGAIVSVILIPFLVIGYYAGLFYHVTGYEGSVGWFIAWSVLSIISIIQGLYQRELIKIASWVVTMFLIYMMGGMGQLSNIF